MAEALSPNTSSLRRQRPPTSPRFQSRTTSSFRPSNDDELERSQSLALRGASTRRQSLHFSGNPPPPSLLLQANRLPCCNRLPEDCHYQPEDLVMLFFLPTVTCLVEGKTRAFSAAMMCSA